MDRRTRSGRDAQALSRGHLGDRRTRRRRVRRDAIAALVLFDRDLRLDDHAALAEAARSGEVVPALIVEPRALARLARNPRRAAYYCAAAGALARDLERRGALLICRRAARNGAALRLAREIRAERVVWSAGYDARAKEADRALQSTLEEAGFRVSIVHDAPAVAPDDTAAARSDDGGIGYRALGPYIAAWRLQTPAAPLSEPRFARMVLHGDALPTAAELGVAADPGEPAEHARAALTRFLASDVLAYRSARDVPGARGTSHLSAALSFGTISAREVVRAIEERARDRFLLAEERASLEAFRRALARRDFFLQLAWFFEERPDDVLQPRMRAFRFERRHIAFDRWVRGETGYPIVDAGMRELRATGWMHPRVRSVAASFLCFDLGLDWRIGRDAWDEQLVEDSPALAAGNWQWIAGVGADLAQAPRIYNPVRQLRAYDSGGQYVRRWIPELAGVSDAELFAAPGLRESPQLSFELFARGAYPAPVVDHEANARTFLERYAAFAG